MNGADAMDGLGAIEEMGPIDYLLVEWQETRPHREIAPQLVELVGQGLIRILDLVFMAKAEDGTVEVLEISDMPKLAILEGASSGLLDDEDIETAGAVMEPGTSAALLVFENVWAAPFAVAMRKSGGQVVSSGRIPIQQMLGALEAAEA
jgi:uncharacterized membrane protein